MSTEGTVRIGWVCSGDSLDGGDGDGVSECFELTDEVSGFADGIDQSLVVAGSEVFETGGRVVDEVPDGDQHRSGHGTMAFLRPRCLTSLQ